MKTISLLITITICAACSDTGKKYPEYDAGTSPETKQDTSKIPGPETRTDAVIYAEAMLSGHTKPEENNETYAWLDSLQATDPVNRQLAYRVTELIINKGQGFLAESAGGHVKSYFQVYPKDFLANYQAANAVMQKKLIENCAYEFYASGTDYAVDIDNYFKDIAKACRECTTGDESLIAGIRMKITNMVKAANE